MTDETRQTAKVWEADLGEAGRRLTLEELAALEQLHQCQLLGRLVTALEAAGLHLLSLERRLDRVEQWLQRVDARYPASAEPLAALAERGR